MQKKLKAEKNKLPPKNPITVLLEVKATLALCVAVMTAFFLLSDNPFFLGLNVIGGFSFSLSQFWNIFPHVFVHNSFVHLIANVSAILVFGVLIEKRIGFRHTVMLFIISAALPAILFSIMNPQYSIFGASAVSSGLLGASFLLQPKKTLIASIILVAIIVLMAKPVGMMVFEQYKKGIESEIIETCEKKIAAVKSGETAAVQQLAQKEKNLKQFLDSLRVKELVASGTSVANAAHAFGAITGFAYAYFFIPNKFNKRWRKRGKK